LLCVEVGRIVSVRLLAAAHTCGDDLEDILMFVEAQLERLHWSVIIWVKSVTTKMDDNAPLLSPKCHIVTMMPSRQGATMYAPRGRSNEGSSSAADADTVDAGYAATGSSP
jgi:hypothetical protein